MKFLFLLLFSLGVSAKDYTFSDYDLASESDEFIKFESESTKLGLITTSFDGYAKSFKTNIEKNNDSVNKVEVILNSKSIDTDSGSRNEKMHELCLSADKFPFVIFSTQEKIALKEDSGEFIGKLKVKDTEKPVKVVYEIYKKEDKFFIKGSTSFSLKEFKVADPSIAIASVRDNFDIRFNLEIN